MLSDILIGRRCIVFEVPPKYKPLYDELIDVIGTIVEIHDGKNIGLKIPGVWNEKSERGIFWFNKEQINFLEESEMKLTNFDKDVKFATVVDIKGDACDIGAYYGELKEGDIVVCNYGYSNGKLSVRRVCTPYISKEAVCPDAIECEIMGVADISDYVERQTKRERRAELKRQMIEQAKRFQEEEYWRLLSESDPDMAKLYNEFKELDK